MAAADTAPAQDVDVVSQGEAQLRADTGSLANGQAAPEAQMVDTSTPAPPPRKTKEAPSKQTESTGKRPSYWDAPPLLTDDEKAANAAEAKRHPPPVITNLNFQANQEPPGEKPPGPGYWYAEPYQEAPPAPVPAKPQPKTLGDRVWALTQGALGQSNRLAQLLALSGETVTSLTQKISKGMGFVSEGEDHSKMADQLAKEYADKVTVPLQENQQLYELGPNADFTDKLMHGVGSTLMFIDQMMATGGEAAPVEAGASTMTRVATGLESGAQMAQVPAVANALQVGRQVKARTGNDDAALTAAITSYTTTIATAGIPMGVGKGLPTRLATAGAAGAAAGEVQRRVQNAAMPESMQTPFDLEETAVAALTTAPFGLLHPPKVHEVRNTAMEEAEAAAAEAARREGGDNLDQVVAATHASMAVGAVHDAVSYEAHMRRAAELSLEPEEPPNKGIVEPNEGGQQIGMDKLELETPTEEAKRSPSAAHEMGDDNDDEGGGGAPSAKTLFERREAEQAKQKDEDYDKALNQKGQQDIERGDMLEEGAKKGGATEPGPTLADTLTPEQQQAFKDLAARRAAEPPKVEVAPEDKVMPYTEPKGGEKNPIVGTGSKVAPIRKGKGAVENQPSPEEAPQVDTSYKPGSPLYESDRVAQLNPTPEARARRQKITDDFNAQQTAAKPPQTLAARRSQAATQPSESPAPTAGKPTGAQSEPIERPEEGDEWKAADGTKYEVVKDNQDGTYKIRSTPADTAQKPIVRKMKEASLAVLRARTEAEPTAEPAKPAVQEPVKEAPAPTFAARRSQASERIAQMAATEKAIREEGNWQRLMAAKSGEHKAIAAKMTPQEAQMHLERLDAAPGTNARARVALEARAAEADEGIRFGRASDEQIAQVEHTQDSKTNPYEIRHRYSVPGKKGLLEVNEYPGTNTRQVRGANVITDERGRGWGSAMLERAVQDAHAAGQRFISDDKVSDSQQGAYAHLRDKGYKVIERPHSTDTGQKIAYGNNVYEVQPKPANMREATKPAARGQTKEAVTRHLQPLIDRMGADKFQVHDDYTTLPDNVKQSAADLNIRPGKIGGAYDPTTGTIHIVASAHPTLADAHDMAVHELAHEGIRNFLGDDYNKVMRDIYANIHDHESAMSSPIDGVNKATGKSWIKDYMDQHGLDPRNARDQAVAADEYAAHLAEHPDENPSILQRVYDAVRAGLRKVGMVREWTDADIRRLLRESNNNQISEHARAAREYQGDAPRFGTREDRQVDQLAATNPLSRAHKFGRTMEDQANYNPGFIRSRYNFAKDWSGDRLRDGLAFIHMRNLPDFMRPDLMPSLRQFIRIHDAMTGRRGKMMEESSQKLQEWSRWASKNKEQAASLGDLMHSSTLAGSDPSKPFEYRYGDEERAADPTKVAHDQLRQNYHRVARRQYNALDDTGKRIFNETRDHYMKQRKDIYDALNARIEASGADQNTKQQMMAQLRKTFESNRVQGPYFPLQRYGDRMGSAHDKDGNVVAFSRFESKSEQQAWLRNMKDKGFEVRAGQKMDDKSMMERIDPKFVQKVMQIAKDADPKLADEIWQTYLKAMPEMSMRKHLIHRVGRLGYTMDAMRNFAYNSFHGAHQIARLEYGHRLDSLIDNMKTEANSVMEKYPGSKNADWAPALAKEMARRYEWVKNPRASPLASALTKFGFGWYLSAAPATAFRIFSQNPMLAQPILAGYHGQLGATKELSRASAQWAMSKGSLGDKLRGDERKAFDTAADRGVFSSTATQTLASGASDIPVTGHWATAAKAMGYMFNAMEHHNRMTTYLAGYRLGRQQGMTHEQAVDHATDVTWDAHFDYTNANRPRVLQNNVAKVLGLFKQYSWGVTYRLAREARNMFDGELSGEDRVRATKTFGGLLARCGMFAGVTGLPFSWLVHGIINAVFHDKDKPFDAEAAEHEYLRQHLGQTAADAIMTGPVGALTHASLSGGASYSDLWYRPPSRDENAHDTVLDAFAQAGGAIPAIPLNAASGVSMMADGQIERGLEHFVPPEAAALMKAIRYNREGVTNLQGEQLLDRDKLDNMDLFLQLIGFTPQKVADVYRQDSTLKNISKAILDRKKAIENAIAVKGGMGDEEGVTQALAEAEHFNEVNPGVAIDARGLLNSVKGHFLNQAEAINGVRLPPGLSNLRDLYGGNEEPNQ